MGSGGRGGGISACASPMWSDPDSGPQQWRTFEPRKSSAWAEQPAGTLHLPGRRETGAAAGRLATRLAHTCSCGVSMSSHRTSSNPAKPICSFRFSHCSYLAILWAGQVGGSLAGCGLPAPERKQWGRGAWPSSGLFRNGPVRPLAGPFTHLISMMLGKMAFFSMSTSGGGREHEDSRESREGEGGRQPRQWCPFQP